MASNSAGSRTEVDLMLDFVRRWHPYGGGTAGDILVTFGMTEHAFFRRVMASLDERSQGPDDAAIRAVCLHRLRSVGAQPVVA